MSRRSVVVSLVAAACLLLSSFTSASADENSLNWAGYYTLAKPGQKITQVSGTTYVPRMKLAPPTLAASWVGIGGATTSDLIQAGVAFGQLEGYYAWFERLPESIQPIRSGCAGDNRCRVVPGDRIDMDIRHLGGNNWRMSLVNVGKWSWSMDTPYNSSFTSAEWIFEAPSYFGVYTIPANVPHAQFFNNRYTVDGQARMLKQAEAYRTHVSVTGAPRVSTTSAVRSDSAFKVCPYKQTCPRP